jgi:GDP-L-fucose synthase
MSSVLNKNDLIYVAGHNGMVGSSILRQLNAKGFCNILTASRKDVDLTNQLSVNNFFLNHKIDYVVLAAAKVGGIFANNSFPADFIYENLMIECNVINSAYKTGVNRLLFLGSSCIYPKLSNQPIDERDLLTGVLEPTNEPYAIAKIAGIKLCESYNRQFGTHYRSVMPTNLYGIGDNFDLNNSHVVPALLRKFHEAKINNDATVNIWGDGSAKREFLYVDDMASACIHIMNFSDSIYEANTLPTLSHINVGSGIDLSISELAHKIKDIVEFKGDIVFDTAKPNGPPRKLLNVSKLNSIGWSYETKLKDGLQKTYNWYLDNINSAGSF